jgi:hypothetical protein
MGNRQPHATQSRIHERVLLFTTIVLLPFEEAIPTLGGLSAIWILFGLIGIIALQQPRDLFAIAFLPTFLCFYLMVLVAGIIELSHSRFNLGDWTRLVQVIVGAILIATLIKDRSMLRWAILAYVGIGVILCVVFFRAGYHGLSEIDAEQLHNANGVRSNLYSGSLVAHGTNLYANYAAQAALCCLALTIGAKSGIKQMAFLAATMIMVVSTFLSMSRGGSAACAVGIVVILLRWRGISWRPLMMGLTIAYVGYQMIPEAAFSRQTFRLQKKETRSKLYVQAFELIPEYAAVGVGSGNYWSGWAVEHGFKKNRNALGLHNCFLQLAIIWGVVPPTLLALGCIGVWRCLPGRGRIQFQTEALALSGLAVGTGVFLMVSHVYYAKIVSLTIGLIVGSRYWSLNHANADDDADASKKPLSRGTLGAPNPWDFRHPTLQPFPVRHQ